MKAKGYSVRKGEYNQNASRQPYPGVIIEEMLDSVSVHSGVEHENYPVALIGDHQEEMKPKEPDVSASKIVTNLKNISSETHLIRKSGNTN